MLQAISNAVILRRPAMQSVIAVALATIMFTPIVLAQVDDPPNALQPPAETEEAQDPAAAFGAEFAGHWGVSMPSRRLDDAFRSGFAEVNEAGAVILTLDGPEGEERFQSIEIEMQPNEDANEGAPLAAAIDAGLKKQFTIHFKRASAAESASKEAAFIGPAEFIELPQNQSEIEFTLRGAAAADGDADLRLPINWLDDKPDRLRIRFGAVENVFRRDGVWDNAETEGFESAGQTTWRRTVASIDDIVVVDNQTVQNYPFKIDETDAARGGSKTRRLIVIGENLRDLTKFGAAVRSDSNTVEYAMGPRSLSHTDPDLMLARAMTDGALAYLKGLKEPNQRVIARLEARREGLLSPENLLVLYATLKPGVTPGYKRLSIDDAQGSWPLLFANQNATLQFSRYNDQVRSESVPVFYPGDIGAVDVVLKADIPFDSIGVRLLHRSIGAEEGEDAKEVASLLAKRMDDSGATDELVFRTDPIHFTSFANPQRRPPDDEEAFSLNVLKGDKIGARLLEPSKLNPQPPVAIAEIYLEPNELGELWKSALKRVAQCDGDAFDGDPLYALEKSTRFSEFTVGELVKYVSPLALIYSKVMDSQESTINFNPSVDVYKGDHAATLLIRDELVEMMSSTEIILPITALARNDNGEIQALRARAVQNGAESEPLIKHGGAIWRRKPFWRQPTIGKALKSLFGQSGAATSTDKGPFVPVPLSHTLNIQYLAERFDVPYTEAEAWAIRVTKAAAQRQLDDLQEAIGRAYRADNCDVEELLVVAGQEAGPVVSRIIPRLVEKVSHPGSPPTEYWQPDKIARFYVERVHLAGAAVRALDQYGAIDDAYKAMAIAVATAGAAFVATAAISSGGAAIGAGILIAGDVADAAYFGVKGLNRAIESQDFYDYANGASLVLGDEILIEAEAQRESVEMALIGLIAPGVGAGIGVKDLRHFRNIDKGKALIKAKGVGVLGDLDSLTKGERTQIAAYLDDTLAKTQTVGLDALDDMERAAMESLYDQAMLAETAKWAPPGAAGSASDSIDESQTGIDLANPFREADTELITLEAGDTFRDIVPDSTPLIRDAIHPPREYKILDGQLDVVDHKLAREVTDVPNVNASAGSIDGSRIIDSNGNVIADLGEELGAGSFSRVHADPDDAGFIQRVTPLDTNPDHTAKSIEDVVFGDAVGRRLLEDAESPDGFFRVTKRDGDPILVTDDNGQRFLVSREENIASQVDGKVVTNAADRFANRPPTKAEQITMQLAMRELNQKGIVWTDHKMANFDIVPDAASPTGHRMVLFDPGGFQLMKGGKPELQWRNARQWQQTIDAPHSRMSLVRSLAKGYDDALDLRPYGGKNLYFFTPAANRNRPEYLRLNNLDPAAFRAEVDALSQQLGTQINYAPPGG